MFRLYPPSSSPYPSAQHSFKPHLAIICIVFVMMHTVTFIGYAEKNKPSVFEEVLRPRFNFRKDSAKKILQVEIHVFISPSHIKASILLNKLRLMCIFDLILELKNFIFDKMAEDLEDGVSGMMCVCV